MKYVTAICMLLALTRTVSAQSQTSDEHSYCNYVMEQAQATSLLLRTPSAAGGITHPNTGTQAQYYTGLAGSLSDFRRGALTIAAAKPNCALYKSTTEAEQNIQYAPAFLEKEALQHRVAIVEGVLRELDAVIDRNVMLVAAQSATKISLYALQAARARLLSDKAAAQRSLAGKFVPDLASAPLSRLVVEKQADEERNQRALDRSNQQSAWDLRWEFGYHKTIGPRSSLSLPASPSGAYGGLTFTYNLGLASRRVNKHLDAAARSYSDWKMEEQKGVAQSPEDLRQQIVAAIDVEKNRLKDLQAQAKSVAENLSLVKDASTNVGITFQNQLIADRLVLDVDMKDAQFRLERLQDFLSYNWSETASNGRVSITFDDGFESAYRVATPILDRAGIKATWYIITGALGEHDYMSVEQLKKLAADGHEIGAHTRTHPHLSTLTLTQQQQEIGGSMADLKALGITPASFAYPYGEYNNDSLAALRTAGFRTARTTNRTLSGQNSFLLQGLSITPETTSAEIIQAIDSVQRNGTWLILTFHRIDEAGNGISASHELLQDIVDYLVQHKLEVRTVGQQ